MMGGWSEAEPSAHETEQHLGRYTLLEPLGQGGMGAVYRAEFRGPGGFRKQVAVKLIRPDVMAILPHARDVLFREARLAALLRHRHVVDVYEPGEEDGRTYIAMELVEGLSLHAALRMGQPPVSVLLEVGIAVGEAVHHAHSLLSGGKPTSLVHGDLKPSNILLGWDGSVKVADFGIARLLSGGDSRARSGQEGTLGYAAPEQVQGADVDARSDQFSLGLILYEMGLGRPLLLGATAAELIAQTAQIDALLSCGDVERDLDGCLAGLGAVVVRCLRADPASRYSGVDALLDGLRGLQRAAGGEPRLVAWLHDALADVDKTGAVTDIGWHSDLAASAPVQSPVTLNLDEDAGDDLDTCLARLVDSAGFEEALSALAGVEAALCSIATADLSETWPQIRVAMASAGLDLVASGNAPFLVIDPDKGTFWYQGAQVARFRKRSLGFRLLHTIATQGDELDRGALYTEAWDQNYLPPSSDNALYVQIHKLRDRLEPSGLVIDASGDGSYVLRSRPAVVCWRGEPVAIGPVVDSPVVGLPVRPETNIQPQLDGFFGRHAQLAQLDDWLVQGEVRLVTLLGPPGAGKTRLSREIGLQFFEDQRFEGGVWFCDLTDARTLQDVVVRVAPVLGVPLTGEQSDDAWVALLGRALACRGPVLLIVDNAEAVADDLACVVQAWLAAAVQLRCLVTSRVPLRLAAEQRCPLEPLPVPAEDAADLADNPALALVLDRTMAIGPDLVFDVAEMEQLAGLVRDLEGLPLALELAAGWLRMLSPAALRERLATEMRMLRRSRSGQTDRQATLMGAIDVSWQMLKPWEQAALAQLSVFRGGFFLESAEAILDLSPWPEAPWSLDVVGALVDASLLRHQQVHRQPRFGMYLSVREFAAQRLAAPDAVRDPQSGSFTGPHRAQATARAHAEHMAHLGEIAHLDGLELRGGTSIRKQLALEHGNLLAGLDTALAMNDGVVAGGCALAALAHLRTAGPFARGIALVEELQTMSDVPSVHRIRALTHYGRLQVSMGDRAEGLRAHEEACATASAHGLSVEEARARIWLSICMQAMGDQRAKAQMETALAMARQHNDRFLEGRAQGFVGSFLYLEGQIDAARSELEMALQHFRAVGSRSAEAWTLSNLGITCYPNDPEQGRVRVSTALKINRGLGVLSRQASDLGRLAVFLDQLGDHSGGKSAYLESVALQRVIGNRQRLQHELSNLGAACIELGDFDEALAHLAESLAIAQQIELIASQASVWAEMALAHRLQGQPAEALGLLTEAMGLVAQVDNRSLACMVRGRYGEHLLATGRVPEAAEELDGAIATREASDVPGLESWMFYGSLAVARARLGDFDAAFSLLAQGQDLLRDTHVTEYARILCRRCEVQRLAGDAEAARTSLDVAAEIVDAHGFAPASRLAREIAEQRSGLDEAS